MTDTLKNTARRIDELKREKNAVILAHNYQVPEVQDIADYVGDSLGLSRKAAQTGADVIVFCGVHFMAETASIISPDKKVLIPDPQAGCSLADTITLEQLKEWKNEHPGAVVVSYVNTSAAVKSESDYCVTSSNAVKVVESIPEDRKILFLPDIFLGSYVAKQTGREMEIWPGECHVHSGIKVKDIKNMKARHPGAEVVVHPECGCTTHYLYNSVSEKGEAVPGDVTFLSTSGMTERARKGGEEFIVATETGMLHRLRKDNPSKKFFPASESAVCEYMKMITLDKVLRSLEEEIYEVKVPQQLALRAKKPIDRMLGVSAA
ncbi:MAG: quinolinate synthase NadA [Thermodesulfobacteriota bacterium]